MIGHMEDDRDEQQTPPRTLPDAAICRVENIVPCKLFGCLVTAPSSCPHALPFGKGYFCLHPEREQIAARTKL